MNTKPATSPAVIAKLEKARAALDGRSPRQIGAEKQRIALDWIYRWGWSSPTLLDAATGGARSGISARLIKNRLLVATATEGSGVKGTPNRILTLTPTGLDETERHCLNLINYEIDPYRIDQTKLRHDGLAQQATAKALKSKSIISFKTPKELAAKSTKETKQPDVLWITDDGLRIGIEVELSAKWERKLDQFVHGCLISLSPNHRDRINSVDEIYLITDSNAIIKRYSAAFTPGKEYDLWKKNERGFWVKNSDYKVPDWVKGKITCQLM